ncbi:MAG: hypothetical protein COW76_20395 [Shewanella sp. CG18_big_fil_WC_8_21_14_2_50_42_11]|uniref:AAA family ATPase n=1 Tax=Shewanella sp. CG18_big_fil_WC_8_21_14_2_50_42_11 TaxID=1975538 RepID=UPI000C67D1F7|nr:AAA family ATPase [Shewanella sp. CG18_big_fil_WC_8_21_14_2_50_42_11]PIP98524.1 MAG: hypothetical protein COW76_20395 [Shewanella sp. CG18_big_fil_WC_8_21_14_2_50_42_11]
MQIEQDLRGKVASLLMQGEMSQSKLSKETDVHASALSQWRKGVYKGDNNEIERKIKQWFDKQNAQKISASTLPTAPKFVPTPTAQKIINTLTYAHIASDLVIIYGGAGVSKTTAIKEYAANSNNVWIVEATPSRNTGGSFLRAVAYACGMRIPRGHADQLEREIIERLTDTEGLLIVDEAQFLNDRALENARRLAELSGVGLALLGNESVYGQLIGQRRAAEYAQLFSRIGKRLRLTRPTKKDVDMIAEAWQLGKDETIYCQDIASRPGALRGLNKAIRLASIFAKGEKITTKHLKASWADLTGE